MMPSQRSWRTRLIDFGILLGLPGGRPGPDPRLLGDLRVVYRVGPRRLRASTTRDVPGIFTSRISLGFRRRDLVGALAGVDRGDHR